MKYFALISLIFISAVCSLSYELIISKLLSHITGQTALFEALCIGTFMASFGLGIISSPNGVSATRYWKKLTQVELTLSFLGLLTPVFIIIIHSLYRVYIYNANIQTVIYGFSALEYVGFTGLLIVCPIGLLSGFELSLLLKVSQHKLNQGFVLASSYFGSLVASLLYSIYLVKLSPLKGAIIISFFNLCLALYLSALKFRRKNIFTYASILSILLVIAILTNNKIEQIYLKNFYYNISSFSLTKKFVWHPPKGLFYFAKSSHLYPKVKRIYSHYQAIDIVADNHKENDVSIFLDGHYQFRTSREKKYHKSMVDIPFSATSQMPKSVLIIGGGDGLLVRELLRYESVSSITLVELDPEILKLAHGQTLNKINENSLLNKKVKVHSADGFQWIKQNKNIKFDAIFSDLPYPYSTDGLRLFSQEFFLSLKKVSRVKTIFIFNIPKSGWLSIQRKDDLQVSLREAGWKYIWNISPQGESFIMASDVPVKMVNKYVKASAPHRKKATALTLLKLKRLLRADPYL